MKIVEIKAGSKWGGDKCTHCKKRFEAGQNIVVGQEYDNAYRRVGMAVHVACVRQLIDGVVDSVHEEFERLRNEIIKSGKAFPE